MDTPTLTYAREGDQILAFYEGRVIAHGKKFAAVEQTAVDYLDSLTKKKKVDDKEKKVNTATRVKTPSGLRGEILSNTEGIWGEREITVRWENGRIAKYQAHAGSDEGFEYSTPTPEQPGSVLEYFESTLSAIPDGDRESLVNRVASLDTLITKASNVIQSGVSYADEHKIDEFVVQAEHEKIEAKQALEHLESADAEMFAPPAPFRTAAVEQADLGRTNGSWLDHTVNAMVAEAEAQDLDKLLLEGAPLLAAELDTAALADAGVTRNAALTFITEKTAGLQGEDMDKFREQFLDRVEIVRREELKDRAKQAKKSVKKQVKKQSQKTAKVPDDALFM